MKRAISGSGDAAAILGVLICLVSGVFRVTGSYYLLGFELMSLFTGGMGLMVFACLAKLHLLGTRRT